MFFCERPLSLTEGVARTGGAAARAPPLPYYLLADMESEPTRPAFRFHLHAAA